MDNIAVAQCACDRFEANKYISVILRIAFILQHDDLREATTVPPNVILYRTIAS